MQKEFTYIPSQQEVDSTNIMKLAGKLGIGTLKELYDYADNDVDGFWKKVIQDCEVIFDSPYSSIADSSQGVPWTKWFLGGMINIAYNTVGKYRDSKRSAIKFERENGDHGTISFAELDEMSGRLGGALRKLGVKKGDRVAIFMPLSPESVIALYSVLRIGAVAVPIFSGYGRDAVEARLDDAGIRHIFTFNSYHRRGKVVDMIHILDGIDATKIVYDLPADSGNELDFYNLIQTSEYFGFEATSSEDPAIMLYTSGTTGKPKGTVHVHGGALVNIVKEVKYYMDMKQDDTLFWVSDPGWMMGPWSMIGANALGGSIFTYDGALDYPEEDRLWKIISRHGVTILGLSPTLVRSLRSKNQDSPLRGIRVFGSTGEPWDTESWMWLFEKLGASKVPIANISGGTDIIGCFLASTPAMPLAPRCLYRGLGMRVSVFDESGNEIVEKIGYLVAKGPSPSMTRGLWNQPEKYIETYWSKYEGVWNHGDWALMDSDGYFYLYGRADDVIKVAGKRVGPNEIEDMVAEVEGVIESAVVGIPDEIKGETLGIFYVSVNSVDLSREIKARVEKAIGKAFSPGYVVRLDLLPKTRNGKIMRRVVRNAFTGEPLGDISGLEDPGVPVLIGKISPLLQGKSTEG
ncbi:MAG: AMP-binding protein [Thermoplasmataceae archaeon]